MPIHAPVVAAGPADTPPYAAPTNHFNTRFGETYVTLSESNMRCTLGADAALTSGGLLVVPRGAAQSGKFVVEFERMDNNTCVIGMTDMALMSGPQPLNLTSLASAYSYSSDGRKANNGLSSYGDAFGAGDKVSILLDCSGTTLSLYFAKNGVVQAGGVVAFSGITPAAYIPAFCDGGGANNIDMRVATTLTYTFPGYTQWR